MASLARDEDILKAAEDWKAAGRGVAVSKSDFATYTWTLLALRAGEASAGTASS